MAIFDRLKKLFSTTIVLKNADGKLKVTDTGHYQAQGNPYQTRVIDRYGRLHGTRGSNVNPYHQYNGFSAARLDLYTDYEAMDEDAIISSALDIYADEATTKAENGQILLIKTENDNIRKILTNLFYDILNIQYNIWPWTRNLVKYGDFYLRLDIRDELGIINVFPLSAYEVTREDGADPNNLFDTKFIYEGALGKAKFENYEIAHFRLLSDTNFLPYGRSILEGARKLFKQITLMEDAMMIHRVMRAPEKRIFKLDIGNIPPAEVDQYMQAVMNQMKKTPFIDEKTGQYNLRYNMQNILEDFYLPVRGQNNGTDITTLNGLQYQAIEDLEYLRSKLFASLKIPKAFLGYDDTVEGKATLAAEDIRFARTIERIQRIIESELTKIAIIHLYAQGFKESDLIDFSLELTSPSIIYEQEKINLLKQKVELFTAATENKALSKWFIYKNIFNMSEEEANEQINNILEDSKFKFRTAQIETEGNDPVVTKQSYGTPHDIASMEIPTPGAEPGRPKENKSSYKTDDHYLGRDPLGRDANSDYKLDKKIKHNYRGNSPLSNESSLANSYVPYISSIKIKSKDIISKSLLGEAKQLDNTDNDESNDSTFLSEKNIINSN
jgi:hypothetical protein